MQVLQQHKKRLHRVRCTRSSRQSWDNFAPLTVHNSRHVSRWDPAHREVFTEVWWRLHPLAFPGGPDSIPQEESTAAVTDPPCRVSKRSPFCYRWEKPGQACLFKLHYPLQTFALTDELEEDFRSISNRSCFSSSVLSLSKMLCQEHIQPWKQISRHNKAQTGFLKNSVCSESIFPASHLQFLSPFSQSRNACCSLTLTMQQQWNKPNNQDEVLLVT